MTGEHRTPLRSRSALALALAGAAWAAPLALAQTQPAPAATVSSAQPAPAPVTTGSGKRDTLTRLSRPVSIEFTDKRLEDVMAFIANSSGADIVPMWADDRSSEGLNKDMTLSLKVTNVSYLTLIERVLERAQEGSNQNTWQLSDSGSLEVGPKSRLNNHKRFAIYDINDMLLVIPNYEDAPQIDLQQAIQASQSGRGGGGGGGQGPFRNDQQQQRRQMKDEERKRHADEILDIVRSTVEPEEWQDAGGNGGTIRYYNGTILVNAADYIHRGLVGYPNVWPRQQTVAMRKDGRRYVTLTSDNGISTLDGVDQKPATAVVGGRIIRSDQPPGGPR
jgi:hypothetical protein